MNANIITVAQKGQTISRGARVVIVWEVRRQLEVPYRPRNRLPSDKYKLGFVPEVSFQSTENARPRAKAKNLESTYRNNSQGEPKAYLHSSLKDKSKRKLPLGYLRVPRRFYRELICK